MTSTQNSAQTINDHVLWSDITFYSADFGEVSRGHAEWAGMLAELRDGAVAGAYLTQEALDAWSNPDLDPEDFDLAVDRIDWDGYEEYAEIARVVRGYGEFAYGSPADLDRAVQEWIGHDFTDAGVKAWLNAGAFTAHAANALHEAGVTPEEAGERREELDDRGNTIGYAVANGDLSVANALKILGR